MKSTHSQSALTVFVVVAASQTAAVASFSNSVELRSKQAAAPELKRSRMNLLPSEGSALVAGWNDVYGTKTYDSHSTVDVDEPPLEFDVDMDTVETICSEELTKPRTFLARIFSFHRRELSLDQGSMQLLHGRHGTEQEDDGSLIYPVVGFRWVKTNDNKYRVLPTMDRASCSIDHLKHLKGERVLGWYTAAAESEDPALQP